MTKREEIVLSAFTGKLLCDFDDYHKYVEELFGSTIYTQELPMLKEDIKERAEADAILNLGNEDIMLDKRMIMVLNECIKGKKKHSVAS